MPKIFPFFLLILTAAIFPVPASAQSSNQAQTSTPARVWQDTIELPTYEEGLPDENPPFDQFVTNGRFNYPYTMRENLTNRVAPRKWRALNLENEYLKCVILPDLGGHLYRCVDKRNGADIFYANPSLKFARIAYRGVWAAYGIEFNFPVSHNWMTASPVDFFTSTAPDGSASVWVRNIDRVYGMEWCVQLTLHPGQALLEQKTTLYNPSRARHRFYWWTNAGVQVSDNSRLYYPQKYSVTHGFVDLDTWPVDRKGVDLSVVGNHKFGPVSRFSYGSNEPYMAVYHSKTDAGIVHYSARTDLPSKKVFSWGSDAEGLDWRNALSDNHSAYVEIQAGLFRDQETYGFLDPQQSIHFTEIWMPILELGGVAYATPDAILNWEIQTSADGRSTDLDVALNVTHDFPGAKLQVLDGDKIIASDNVPLSPQTTFRKRFSNLEPSKLYAVRLTDESGKTILTHTQDQYDFLPQEDIPKELPPPYKYPPAEKRSESDFMQMGLDQESNGELLIALSTYRDALQRFPDSVVLHRAMGRLQVTLKQFHEAIENLAPVVTRVSTDKEASYYLGLAYVATNDIPKARRAFEVSEQFGTFRAPSLFELAALDARRNEFKKAQEKLAAAYAEFPDAQLAGDVDVSLLRHIGNPAAAMQQLEKLQPIDPANSFLRYEAVLLGRDDPSLWPHLAADPERILNIAVLYMHFGFYSDALDLLSRRYTAGEGVVSEPGMPQPDMYPLIAYYRGFCRDRLKQNGQSDFLAAAKMPTTYAFPNRPESIDVLQLALSLNPGDASAHALLGSLYMSSGMEDAAMKEWDAAREMNPAIPALLRNMGYTALYTKQPPDRAIELFTEGIKYDALNSENYLGLERALREAGRPMEERIAALQKFSGTNPPARLIFQLTRDLADAGRYEEAQKELATRFISLEEGGASQLDVYLEVKLKQARALSENRHCEQSHNLLQHLGDPAPQIGATKDALALALHSQHTQKELVEIQNLCATAN